MITEIRRGDEILTIIPPRDFTEPGIQFGTPPSFHSSSHICAKVIEAHVHNPVVRDTKNTLEVLFVKRGRLRVDFVR
jgi:hypothetical protein